MKEEIAEFKKKNGNNNYANKDFLMFIASKVEKIDDRLVDGAKDISANKLRSKIALWGLGAIIAAVLAQIFKLI